MNKNFKKILTTALVSTAALSAIGCGAPNAKLAKNIDKGMADFVSSINKLDYVDSQKKDSSSIGKIVETATGANAISDEYLTKTLEELNVENSITKPTERTDNFKLFTLTDSPFISFTSDGESGSFNMQINFSTGKISETSDEINEKINNLILKRSILMIYVNEIYNNRVNLTEENRVAINAYVNVIKENASFLNGNRGMVRNQLSLANDLINNNSNNNLVNYYIIKSGEALETRGSKIDSSISAIDSIIDIIEANLESTSIYYNKNLSQTYEDIFSNLNAENTSSATSENKTLADNIVSSLNLKTATQTKTNSELLTEEKTQNSSSLIENQTQNRSLTRNFTKQAENNTKQTQSKTRSETQKNIIQNRQNTTADIQKENNSLVQNNQNTTNQTSRNTKTNSPQTLEYPQTLELNETDYQKQNSSTKKRIFNNQRNNQQISQNKNRTHHSSDENIKRVPYIRNFD